MIVNPRRHHSEKQSSQSSSAFEGMGITPCSATFRSVGPQIFTSTFSTLAIFEQTVFMVLNIQADNGFNLARVFRYAVYRFSA